MTDLTQIEVEYLLLSYSAMVNSKHSTFIPFSLGLRTDTISAINMLPPRMFYFSTYVCLHIYYWKPCFIWLNINKLLHLSCKLYFISKKCIYRKFLCFLPIARRNCVYIDRIVGIPMVCRLIYFNNYDQKEYDN